MKFKDGDKVIFANPKYKTNFQHWGKIYTVISEDTWNTRYPIRVEESGSNFAVDALIPIEVYESQLFKAINEENT